MTTLPAKGCVSFPTVVAGSQEIVSHRLFGGNASGFLRSSFKYNKLFLQVLVQLQDGCYVPTPDTGERKKLLLN